MRMQAARVVWTPLRNTTLLRLNYVYIKTGAWGCTVIDPVEPLKWVLNGLPQHLIFRSLEKTSCSGCSSFGLHYSCLIILPDSDPVCDLRNLQPTGINKTLYISLWQSCACYVMEVCRAGGCPALAEGWGELYPLCSVPLLVPNSEHSHGVWELFVFVFKAKRERKEENKYWKSVI